MKLSTKGRYGVRMLLDLALHQGEGQRTLKEVSEAQNISQKYMSRLLPKLVRAGFVKSARGVDGGYQLCKDPAEITFLQIVEIMEGPICLTPCVKDTNCPRFDLCPATDIWKRISNSMREVLANVTLQDVIDSAKAGCARETPLPQP